MVSKRERESERGRDSCDTHLCRILGGGHSIHSLLEYIDATGGSPRDLLDQYLVDANNNPLPGIMLETTSHSVWVNSEALRLAGIDDSIQNTSTF